MFALPLVGKGVPLKTSVLVCFFQIFGCCFHFQTPNAPDSHPLFRFMGESWTGSLVESREWLAWNESRQVEVKTKQKQRTTPRATGMNPKAGEILKTGLRKHRHTRRRARTCSTLKKCHEHNESYSKKQQVKRKTSESVLVPGRLQ